MRDLKPCGTVAARARHIYHGEDPCEACAQAWEDHKQQQREQYRAEHGPRVLRPCGTPTAYDRHINAGEEPCEACRAANAKAKAQQGHTKARDRARAELARRYRDEFEEIKAAETTAKGRQRAGDRARVELAGRHEPEFRRLLTDEFAKQAVGSES